jgi:ATP-dependent DNA helicase RecG
MKSAIREAFINMLMHSYYGNGALPIKVTSFEDHFEFSNPGEMRVSREDFLMGGTSRPRNSLLASLFRRIGLAEKSGYGGQKILDVAQKNSLRVPDVILTDNSTKIRLWKTDYLSTLPKMSPYAEQIFLTLYKQNFSSKSEIIAETSLSSYYFDKGYEELSELNLISRIGKSRATRYYLELSDEMKTSRNIKNLKQLEDIMRE